MKCLHKRKMIIGQYELKDGNNKFTFKIKLDLEENLEQDYDKNDIQYIVDEYLKEYEDELDYETHRVFCMKCGKEIGYKI